MTSEVIQGNEWAAYGALDTYSQDEPRDRLPAERHKATEPPEFSADGKAAHRVKGGRSIDPKRKKGREMRSAEQILGIIRERGKRGLPLEDIYRQLYNPTLYLMANARLYSTEGALTRGTTSETLDGMALKKIEQLIDALRHERFRWTAVRRTDIEKKNGKLRPLGIPLWTDKLLQEAIRLILEAYYDPQFSPHSHGFRPDRGCHTALGEMEQTWTGTKWWIEGDIAQCFDRLDHQVLVNILREKLHDNRFIQLIQWLLEAGYLEEWR